MANPFGTTSGSFQEAASSALERLNKLEKQARETRGWLDQEHAQRDKLHTEVIDRIRQLEKHIHFPAQNKQTELKSSAARAQAQQEPLGSYGKMQAVDPLAAYNSLRPQTANSVPMRSDVEAILTMTAFCKRLLEPRDLAYAVTLEVRNEARRALGLKEREV